MPGQVEARERGLLGPDDCQWLGNRLARMNAARPRGAQKPFELAREVEFEFGDQQPDPVDHADAIEALQLEAFEADGHEWWLVTDEEALIASCTHGYEEERGEPEPVE